MFGLNVADKYPLTTTKKWIWGVILDRAVQAISLSLIRPSWYDLFHSPSGTLYIIGWLDDWTEKVGSSKTK